MCVLEAGEREREKDGNQPTSPPHPFQQQDLTCAAWLAPPPRALRPDSDAVLAVGGAAGVVTVLSVVDGAAVALAKGHAAPLADLSGAASRPGFLASLDRNAVLATWRVDAVERGAVCAGVFETGDATCLATHPSGAWIATGHRSGDVKLWPAPGEDAVAADGDASALEALPRGADAAAAGATTLTPPPPARRALDAPVTSLKWITPGRLAALGGDGRGAVWEVEVGKDAPALSAPTTFRAPGSGGLGSAAGRCRLGATRDGAFIVVGGPAGDAAVVDSTTGARVVAIPTPPRVKAGARAAGIAADGSSVLVAAGAGFMFRYEAKEVEGVAGA